MQQRQKSTQQVKMAWKRNRHSHPAKRQQLLPMAQLQSRWKWARWVLHNWMVALLIRYTILVFTSWESHFAYEIDTQKVHVQLIVMTRDLFFHICTPSLLSPLLFQSKIEKRNTKFIPFWRLPICWLYYTTENFNNSQFVLTISFTLFSLAYFSCSCVCVYTNQTIKKILIIPIEKLSWIQTWIE